MTEEIQSHKVILLGDPGVGKTAIITKIIYNEYEEKYISTSSPTYNRKVIKINDKSVALDIWDTMGQEKFLSMNKIFFKGAEVGILVYDITNKNSFERLKNVWFQSIEDECEDNGISKF